jgi:hypothetical protein
MGKKSKHDLIPANSPSSNNGNEPSLTIYWNRVYEKTRTDKLRLREYGLPPNTPVFRIVQCDREKATLYGDVDHVGRKSGDLTQVVRDIIEGRPPEGYSPTSPILKEPSPFFLRTRGKLSRVEPRQQKGRMTAEGIGDKMTIIDANAPLSEEAIDAVADLLLDLVQRKDEEARRAGQPE